MVPLEPEKDSGTQDEVIEAHTRWGSDSKVAALDTKLKRNITSWLKAKTRRAAKDGIATPETVSSESLLAGEKSTCQYQGAEKQGKFRQVWRSLYFPGQNCHETKVLDRRKGLRSNPPIHVGVMEKVKIHERFLSW